MSACTATLEINALRKTHPSFNAEINGPAVPFFAQRDYQCGPAALAMVLAWSGIDVSPDELVPLVYLPQRQGSLQLEIVSASRQFDRIPHILTPSFSSLIAELQVGHPVIVLQNLGLSWYPNWHYAVVIGIDLSTNSIFLHSGTTERYVVNLETFERTWARSEKWALVVLPPEKLPATARVAEYMKSVAYFDRNEKLHIAEQAYKAALKRWPHDIMANMALANFYYNSKNLNAAKLLYQAVIAHRPEYSPAHNNLAQVFFEQSNIDKALLHAKQAVNLGGSFVDKYRETLQEIMTSR
ncbi:MAG: PA2778 family cysteine peptidase [Gammaproteobacteria bacterium]|nr:PA2778 family cysteine peptidase [Gammaproteobacteria bacterium]